MIPGPIISWSKSLLRYKSKSKVMDVVAADRTSLMKKKKDGPSRANHHKLPNHGNVFHGRNREKGGS